MEQMNLCRWQSCDCRTRLVLVCEGLRSLNWTEMEVKGALEEPGGGRPLASLSPVTSDLLLSESSTQDVTGAFTSPIHSHPPLPPSSERWRREEEGDTHDHLPLISFPHLLRWSGVHTRYPAMLLAEHRSWRLVSWHQNQTAARSWWIPQADLVLIVYTWSTWSVNTLTWVYRPSSSPSSSSAPPPSPGPGAALTAASPPTCSLHLAATMCLNPDKLSHRSPLRRVSPSMNTHLTGRNGRAKESYQTEHHAVLCLCVFLLASCQLPSSSHYSPVIIRFRGSGGCDSTSRHKAPDELCVTIAQKYFSFQHTEFIRETPSPRREERAPELLRSSFQSLCRLKKKACWNVAFKCNVIDWRNDVSTDSTSD